MDLADVGVLHASSRSVGVAGVIVRIVVGGVLELVDEIPSREPVIQAKLVVNSQDTLIQVLADAGLIGEEACPSQACRQQPIVAELFELAIEIGALGKRKLIVSRELAHPDLMSLLRSSGLGRFGSELVEVDLVAAGWIKTAAC